MSDCACLDYAHTCLIVLQLLLALMLTNNALLSHTSLELVGRVSTTTLIYLLHLCNDSVYLALTEC